MNPTASAIESPTDWLPDEASLIAIVRQEGSGEWATGVAAGLADIVGRRRGRTFLANLESDSGQLDSLLNVTGGPGLTSALSGATSIASIARSAPERSFTYLPGGESALPLSTLSRMPSFRRLLRKMSAGGGTLLLYVGEEDLVRGVADTAGDLRLSGCIALGTVSDIAVVLGAPLLARVERPMPAAEPAAGATEDASATESADDVGAEAGGGAKRWRKWLPLPAAALALLWLGWILLGPSGTDEHGQPADQPRAASGAVEEAAPTAPEPPPPWTAPAANYSVLVGSYVRLRDAEERRAALAEGGGLYFVSPTPLRGRVYYRVFAGVYEDRADAMAAMERLVVEGQKEAVKLWDVRPVRLAHDLGTFDQRGAADALVESLREEGIPAYVLSESTDEPRYRVYAGAFESEAAASPLAALLADRDMEAELVTRSGIAP